MISLQVLRGPISQEPFSYCYEDWDGLPEYLRIVSLYFVIFCINLSTHPLAVPSAMCVFILLSRLEELRLIYSFGCCLIQVNFAESALFLSDQIPKIVYSCHSLYYRLRAIRGGPLGLVNLTPHFVVIQIFQILFLPLVSFYTHSNISDYL